MPLQAETINVSALTYVTFASKSQHIASGYSISASVLLVGFVHSESWGTHLEHSCPHATSPKRL